jgi:predicted metalloprotease with PDZ domain
MKRIVSFAVALVIVSTPSFAQEAERKVRAFLMENGAVRALQPAEIPSMRRAWLGVHLLDLTPELRAHLSAPRDNGVLVSKVVEGSPADRSRLRAGDVIVSLDGKVIRTSRDLNAAVRERKDGEVAQLEIIRNGSRQQVSVTLADREMRVVDADELLRRHPMPIPEGARIELREAPAFRERIISDCEAVRARARELEKRLEALEKRQ